VVVRQSTWANHGLLASNDPVLDPTSTHHNMEMKREVEEKKLHRTAKLHDISEMRQGSQNLQATKKESCPQNKLMTTIEYISDTKEIVTES